MIPKEMKERIVRLLADIESAGLLDLVQGVYAYEIACRIVDTGCDLTGEEITKEDVSGSFLIASKPTNWGISDLAWKAFCEQRKGV